MPLPPTRLSYQLQRIQIFNFLTTIWTGILWIVLLHFLEQIDINYS